ncbi:Eco57I restriction-modification methylase domain-containing protein [Chromobacterium piscinae]|uniref:Eco57I restriction-modification methylase domain-containing protein n=1 Tax=Chromobacterium piscinae TaxID=686831 RepID=UPI001E3FB7C5|nr:N-6 DNA methylase [Chromobacterium piscinae]MCD5327979.1 SAM-dependent methyltransferase [Chromobacterium piscinae]
MNRENLVLLPDPRADAIHVLHAATAIYTAEPVVNQLLELLQWPQQANQLIDPSCGDGMFLVRALERLLAVVDVHDDQALLRIQGWEIHPQACAEARQRITTRLVLAGRSATDAAQMALAMVHNRDFLTESPTTPSWDIVAGNPPYLRWLNVPQLLRDEYRSVVPGYAAMDLLYSFLDRCTRVLRLGGRIGFVTADRWLINDQAANLRERLGQVVSISHLERLDAKTAFYRPKQRHAGTPPRVHPVAVVLASSAQQTTQPLTRQAIYPGVDARRYAGLPTLGSIARVKLAPWLGTAGVFLVDAVTAATLPAEHLVPVVDASDLENGQVRAASRYAIRTKPGVQPPIAIQQHLQREMSRMSNRGKRTSPWMPPESFHHWDLDRPSLLVPRIAKSPQPYRIEAGRLPIGHNLSIVCETKTELECVEGALHHPLATSWIHDHAPRLEDGYFSLTAPLLRRLPLVIPD